MDIMLKRFGSRNYFRELFCMLHMEDALVQFVSYLRMGKIYE